MSKHYVGMAGLLGGYLPNMVLADTNKKSLVDSLVESHYDDSFNFPRVKTELYENGFVEIDSKFGNEYLEIIECNCEDIENHLDY